MIDDDGNFYEIDADGNHIYPIKKINRREVQFSNETLEDPEPLDLTMGWKKVDLSFERFWDGKKWGPNKVVPKKFEGYNSLFRKNNGLSFDYFFEDPRVRQKSLEPVDVSEEFAVPVYGKIRKVNSEVISSIKRSLGDEELAAILYVNQITGPQWKGGDGVWKSAFRIQAPTKDYLVALTLKKWVVFEPNTKQIRGAGFFDEVETFKLNKSGVTFFLKSKEQLNFSQLGSGPEIFKAFSIAIAKSKTINDMKIKGLRPQTIKATYIGGFGNAFLDGENIHLTIIDTGIVIFGSTIMALNWDSILGIQLGGQGAFQTGGGFLGGGFGIEGALKGIAMATIMNKITTKTKFDCILRINFPNGELTITPETTPQYLEVALSAGLHYLQKKPGFKNIDSSLALNKIVESNQLHGSSENSNRRFCEICGTRTKLESNFCSNCGHKLN